VFRLLAGILYTHRNFTIGDSAAKDADTAAEKSIINPGHSPLACITVIHARKHAVNRIDLSQAEHRPPRQ
jgi:hypothetical protein